MRKFLVINGPNLNMLGQREPHLYGSATLDQIKNETEQFFKAQKLDVEMDWFQSNVEGEIVTVIQHSLNQNYSGVIINPGAYSHTSVAILDALKMLKIPVIEVHLSNTHLREDFRQNKLTAKASTAVIEGFGKKGYALAIYSFLMN